MLLPVIKYNSESSKTFLTADTCRLAAAWSAIVNELDVDSLWTVVEGVVVEESDEFDGFFDKKDNIL